MTVQPSCRLAQCLPSRPRSYNLLSTLPSRLESCVLNALLVRDFRKKEKGQRQREEVLDSPDANAFHVSCSSSVFKKPIIDLETRAPLPPQPNVHVQLTFNEAIVAPESAAQFLDELAKVLAAPMAHV